MIAVTTEPYGDGWRWVLTGTQVYSTEARAHQIGQLQLDATRQGHLQLDATRQGHLRGLPAIRRNLWQDLAEVQGTEREAWLLGQLVEARRQLEAGIDRLRAIEERLTP